MHRILIINEKNKESHTRSSHHSGTITPHSSSTTHPIISKETLHRIEISRQRPIGSISKFNVLGRWSSWYLNKNKVSPNLQHILQIIDSVSAHNECHQQYDNRHQQRGQVVARLSRCSRGSSLCSRFVSLHSTIFQTHSGSHRHEINR